MANYQEGDLILCTVLQVEKTSVFVKLPDEKNGTIISSEIAPGRIRNMRDYVIPNKKIVCKIIRVTPNTIDLSLRRVTTKEKAEVLEQYKQEQTAKSVLNSILKDKAKKIEEKILEKFSSLSEFFAKVRENPQIISLHIPKEFTEQIAKIIQKRKKEVEVKKVIKLKCLEKDGIKRIKNIFEENDDKLEIVYLSAGTFQIKVRDNDYKKANQKMIEFTNIIEKKARNNLCEYSLEEHIQK